MEAKVNEVKILNIKFNNNELSWWLRYARKSKHGYLWCYNCSCCDGVWGV